MSVLELQARNSRPDLFTAADDLLESELIARGRLRFEEPALKHGREPAPSLPGWFRRG